MVTVTDMSRTGNGSRTLRRYDVRSEKGAWLGTFVIADDGYFSAVTDFGTYGYWWSSAGECFRSFLARIDDGYLLGKVSREEYDGAATLKEVKARIRELRRSGSLTKEQARYEWSLIEDRDELSSEVAFGMWYNDTEIDAYELACRSYPNEARNFATQVWPRFVMMLREELAAERAAVAGAA